MSLTFASVIVASGEKNAAFQDTFQEVRKAVQRENRPIIMNLDGVLILVHSRSTMLGCWNQYYARCNKAQLRTLASPNVTSSVVQ